MSKNIFEIERLCRQSQQRSDERRVDQKYLVPRDLRALELIGIVIAVAIFIGLLVALKEIG